MGQFVTRSALAIGAVLVVCAAAGCGGDETTTTAGGASGASGATGPVDRSEYIGKADAICAETDRQIREARGELLGAGSPSESEQERFVSDEVVPKLESEVERLRNLPAPPGEGDILTRLYDDAQLAVDTLEADPSLFDARGGQDPFAEADREAREYGFEECGQG